MTQDYEVLAVELEFIGDGLEEDWHNSLMNAATALRTLQSRNAALEAATPRWLSIKDAPRNGAEVFLYIPRKLIRKGTFKAMNKAWRTIGFWVPDTGHEKINNQRYELFRKHGGYWSNHFRGAQPLNGSPSHFQYLTTPEYCPNCDDTGWVCEGHPDKPWGGCSDRDDASNCSEPGIPCELCKQAIGDDGLYPTPDNEVGE